MDHRLLISTSSASRFCGKVFQLRISSDKDRQELYASLRGSTS
jgi:hypothetical protein